MNYNSDKLLVICGPTATGKTRLALTQAGLLSGELISADARHIYRGLDILTGKDIPEGFQYQISKVSVDHRLIGYYGNGTRIWLTDIAERNEVFSVFQYQQVATKVIYDIWNRGKLPIIAGGTGLFIASLVGAVHSLTVPPDPQLRDDLKQASVEDLQQLLVGKDEQRYEALNLSDRKNPRRLIRAIETASYSGNMLRNENFRNRNILKIGLKAPMSYIEQAIESRIDARLQAGVLGEVRGVMPLPGKGIPSESAIGLDILARVLQGKVTLKDGKREWFLKERQYAKRQLTWFAKDSSIIWYDISKKGTFADMTSRIMAWYTRS